MNSHGGLEFSCRMMISLGTVLGLFMIQKISTLETEKNAVMISQGKMQYEIVKIDSNMPKYGSCWKDALDRLDHGCKHLDDDMQSRLSLAFANCFLQKAGMQTYPCSDTTPIAECLKNVDNNAWNSYLNFFTHTQNMCYFLQSQVWHEETEKTIDRLARSSAKVSESIEDSSRLQDTILSRQEASLNYQRQLVENGTYLSKAIEASKSNVKDMLEEFRASTGEQRNMIFEVFDRVSKLQNLVITEINWLYTVVFYGTSCLVMYLLTATNRTADARLWLLFILSINGLVEQQICCWNLSDTANTLATNSTEQIYYWKWVARYVTLFICAVYLIFKAITFKDLNKINNSLLQEIKRETLDMRRSMECFQVGNKRSFEDSVDNPKMGAMGNWDTILEGHQKHLDALLAEDTGFAGDEEDWSDDSDSFNSTRTDRTFEPCDLSDNDFDVEDDSPPTPTNKDIDSAMEALSGGAMEALSGGAMEALSSGLLTSNREALSSGLFTSNRDIFLSRDISPREDISLSLDGELSRPSSSQDNFYRPPSSQDNLFRPHSVHENLFKPISSHENLQSSIGGMITPVKKVVGRSKGTPRQASTNSEVARTYNLRNRSSIGSPRQKNENETPESFAKEVKKQLSKTRRMANKINMARRKAEENQKFSSDE